MKLKERLQFIRECAREQPIPKSKIILPKKGKGSYSRKNKKIEDLN